MQFDFSQQPGLFRWNRNPTTTAQPLVSIITPFYNSGKHFLQTSYTVLDQTFPFFEWIIVDDGSTDPESLALLDTVAASDPRIRVFHNQNAGPSAARNFGVRQSVTDLILPLDADDLLEPTFIEYCWWMLQKNPGTTWAYPTSLGFQGMEYLWTVPFDPHRMKEENLLAITALIRKDAFLAIGGYSEEATLYNEDWLSWLKLIARGGYPAQSTGEYLFWYRRTDTGVQSQVMGSKENLDANKRIISAAAQTIRDPHPAVLYPKPFTHNWTAPKLSSWDQSVFQKKEKTNILFLFPHLEMGGADKFNLDLIAGLDRNKYDCGIITTIKNTQSWTQRFRQVTPDIFHLANFADPEDYAEFISYYIQSRKVDILFLSNSYHGYYLLPWLRQHFPDLVIMDYVHMEEWYWRNGGYARTSGQTGFVTEKTYVCNSATEEVMVNHFHRAPDTVQTVHIGVDEVYFDPQTVPAGTLYRELSLPESRPIILFICRLHPQKRPFLMLEIAKRVSAKLPQAAFAVVGDGPQEQELKKQAADQNLTQNVFFLGARKDVRPYYRDAKLTLVCSLKEGLSLTAYESCAMGVPVISADVGGQRDLVDNTVGALLPCLQDESASLDGRTFPEEEIESYVDAIVSYLADQEKWETASHACREKVKNGFTISNMVNFFDLEFQRLLTDEALKHQRRETAQLLSRLSPMAEEFYTMEMQMQHAEDYAAACIEANPIHKIKRTLKEEGILSLIRKVLSKIKHILLKKLRK